MCIRDSAREAAVVNNLEVYGMKTLFEVIQLMSDRSNPSPTIVDTRKEFYENQTHCEYDYADVRGQENLSLIHIWRLEVRLQAASRNCCPLS